MTEHKKILIVEDDGIIRERLRIAFENRGYSTINTDTGDDAVRQALSEHPDIVLMGCTSERQYERNGSGLCHPRAS